MPPAETSRRRWQVVIAAVLTAGVAFATSGGVGRATSHPAEQLSVRGTTEYRTDEPPDASHTDDVAVALEALPDAVWSPCLARAARSAAHISRQRRSAELSSHLLENLVHGAGCPDPFPVLVTVTTSESSTVDIVAELRRVGPPEGGGLPIVGLARTAIDEGRHRWRWIALLAGRMFYLADTVPQEIEPETTLDLRFDLEPGLRRPTVVVQRPDGSTEDLEPYASGGLWRLPLAAGSDRGALRVEVVADGAYGPQVVAIMPIRVGTPAEVAAPIAELRGGSPTTLPTDLSTAAGFLVEQVNADRRRIGRPLLVRDPDLDTVALGHSQDMVEDGFFGHVSPTAGGLADRLARVGYRYRAARESLARAGDLADAHRSMMASPAHRAALLADDVERIGVGVVETLADDGRREVVVTEVLTAPIEPARLTLVVESATAAVTADRQSRGLSPLDRLPSLDAAAAVVAGEPGALSWSDATMFDHLGTVLGTPSAGHGTIRVAVVRVTLPQQISPPKPVGDEAVAFYGVAAANLPGDDPPIVQVVWVFSNQPPPARADGADDVSRRRDAR